MLTSQHSGDFADTCRTNNRQHRTDSHSGSQLLGDNEVMITTCCDLWQVCHSHDLAILAKLFHETAYGLCDCSSDTCVDFVKDQRLSCP